MAGLVGEGDRVADLAVLDDLESGGDVADLAGAEAIDGGHVGREVADFEDVGLFAGRHQPDRSSRADLAVDDLDVGDNALVRVVVGVEDQARVGRGVVAGRRRHLARRSLQGRRRCRRLSLAEAKTISSSSSPMNLPTSCGDPLGVGVGKVDLVDDGDDREVVLEGQVDVGHRLRFDALGGVDDEERAFAGGEAAADLVGEVDVAGGVDQVELVV